MAQHGALHDQVGGIDQVAQFQQVAGYPKIRVILVDFLMQQLDAPPRALKPFGGAHDPDVAPHEPPQLVPVVRDDNLFVRIGDAALIPMRQLDWRLGRLCHDVLRGSLAEHQALEQ